LVLKIIAWLGGDDGVNWKDGVTIIGLEDPSSVPVHPLVYSE
jgi:hypothetical protein